LAGRLSGGDYPVTPRRAALPGSGPPHAPHGGQRQTLVGAGAGPAAAVAGRGAMTKTRSTISGPEVSRPGAPDGSNAAAEDSRLTQALEEYRTLLEAGRRPQRQDFLARYPEVAEALSECLAGLEFVHAAANPSQEDPGQSSAELGSEMLPPEH